MAQNDPQHASGGPLASRTTITQLLDAALTVAPPDPTETARISDAGSEQSRAKNNITVVFQCTTGGTPPVFVRCYLSLAYPQVV